MPDSRYAATRARIVREAMEAAADQATDSVSARSLRRCAATVNDDALELLGRMLKHG